MTCNNCQEPSNHLMEVGDEQWCLVCVMDRSTSCSGCLQLCDRYSPQVYEITNKGDTYFVESGCLVKWAIDERFSPIFEMLGDDQKHAFTSDMLGKEFS